MSKRRCLPGRDSSGALQGKSSSRLVHFYKLIRLILKKRKTSYHIYSHIVLFKDGICIQFFIFNNLLPLDVKQSQSDSERICE